MSGGGARIAFPMLTWVDDERFVVGEATFRVIPNAASAQQFTAAAQMANRAGELFVAKPRWRLERYVEILERLEPRHVVELGIYQGGSTALFAELASPRRLVGIDKESGGHRPLDEYIARNGLADVVHVHDGVDQGDREALSEIADREFSGEPLDLVVDDCSHQYEPTHASFNVLFPLLRAGGVYVIEDWPWAHSAVGAEDPKGLYPGQVPLTRLVFELVLAIPGAPGVIADVAVDANSVYVTRGDAAVDPATFDISACSNPRGRELLAPA
jgi:predicted O-methyltransferase YrrM